jgi:adenylate kinase
MIDVDNWPSHRDELTTKLSATTEKWVKAHSAGKITDRELYIVVDALWDTCSGMTQEIPLRILERIHKDLRKQNEARKRA